MIFFDNDHLKDYKWNFGDGTTSNTTYEIIIKDDGDEYRAQYNKHVYTTPGGYNVKIEFANFCGSKGADSLKVFVKNNLMVNTDEYDIDSLDDPTTTCGPVRFFDYGGKSYLWNFGDGSAPVTTSKSIAPHSFTQAGSFNVSLTITNSCANSGTVSDEIPVTNDCVMDVEDENGSENTNCIS